ncbi:hypothetical protein AVEN_118007-1 [Araneus ventricosus]|uniref:Uncharacterized protein n=1 Tax=Araneus ventricosus TaxID=182803 RepID=A0A4Y2C9W5_ARAVE|nr:hypothetical protein AVEN_118007-1 [Araneus ventricosus]
MEYSRINLGYNAMSANVLFVVQKPIGMRDELICRCYNHIVIYIFPHCAPLSQKTGSGRDRSRPKAKQEGKEGKKEASSASFSSSLIRCFVCMMQKKSDLWTSR